MKKITNIDIDFPDANSNRFLRHRYKIAMPNDVYDFYFKDKKDAMSFAAGLSRQLTKSLHELNYFTGELFKVYRQLWPYFSDVNSVGYLFHAIDERFEYAVKGFGLFYAMGELNKIVVFLENIIGKLKAISVRNKQYNVKYHLFTMNKLLNEINKDFSEYGKDSRFRVDYDVKKLS